MKPDSQTRGYSRPTGKNRTAHGISTSLAPTAFRVFLSLAAFVSACLYLLPEQRFDLGNPLSFGLATLWAGFTYWFAEQILTIFILLFPPSLFALGIIELVMK
jgi:hypothetical protein